MSFCYSCMEDTLERLPVSSKACQDCWSISGGTPHDSNMFSILRKGKFSSVNFKGVSMLCILYHELHVAGCKGLELSLVRAKLNLVLLAEDLGKLEEIEEVVNIVAD